MPQRKKARPLARAWLPSASPTALPASLTWAAMETALGAPSPAPEREPRGMGKHADELQGGLSFRHCCLGCSRRWRTAVHLGGLRGGAR
eukprot:5533775-Alexandrium_andersonii.AAC.1